MKKPPQVCGGVERVKGIEPSYRAWEARVLPMNYTRMYQHIIWYEQ